MVNLIPVDPKTVGTQNREGRRGRVSYPIIKAFMEMNEVVTKIDPASTDKNPAYLRSVLTAYCKSHNLPVRLFAQGGELHMMRMDLDKEGNIDPNWSPDAVDALATTEGNAGDKRHMEAVPLDMNEVDRRAEDVAKKSHT